MKRTLILSLGLLTAVSTAYAADEPEETFAWSRATLDLIASGDAARGEEIAKKQKCSKCHGDTGISDEDDTPSIAGQVPAYNYKQMLEYKTKVRESKDMYKKVKKLDLQQMADLAAFYAIQEPEPPEGKTEPPLLVTQGDMERLLLPCNVCHGEKGEGLGFEVPAINGQKIEAFVDTMTEFQDGDRENDQYGRMRFTSSQLSEEEIEQPAAYYAAPPIEEEDEEE